jgi:hypothetical protein
MNKGKYVTIWLVQLAPLDGSDSFAMTVVMVIASPQKAGMLQANVTRDTIVRRLRRVFMIDPNYLKIITIRPGLDDYCSRLTWVGKSAKLPVDPLIIWKK